MTRLIHASTVEANTLQIDRGLGWYAEESQQWRSVGTVIVLATD
jgi:hypothetical protein